MIGIIGAMEEEVQFLRESLKMSEAKVIRNRIFYLGTYNGKGIVLVKAGIGKVNAAITTTLMLEHFEIEQVINIGVAGGIHPANPLDLVVSTNVMHHDVDVTTFGDKYVHGQVPGLPAFYESDSELLDSAIEAAKKLNISYLVGTIVTGDQFVTDIKKIDAVRKHKDDIVGVEMEAAAIAQTCHLYDIPFIVLRSISDILNSENQSLNFEAFLLKASLNATNMLKEILK